MFIHRPRVQFFLFRIRCSSFSLQKGRYLLRISGRLARTLMKQSLGLSWQCILSLHRLLKPSYDIFEHSRTPVKTSHASFQSIIITISASCTAQYRGITIHSSVFRFSNVILALNTISAISILANIRN